MCGGGFYHNGYDSDSVAISECVFKQNTAHYENGTDGDNNRGGGAFEDHKNHTYTSTYSFTFFTGNKAPDGSGHDISVIMNPLYFNDIIHCFTTTASNSVWNHGKDCSNWLPQVVVLDV